MVPSLLSVYWGLDRVGKLWLDAKRHFCFQYDSVWLKKPGRSISIALPLREASYLEDEPGPFFQNLLPEGEVRTALCRELGISEKNDFALLAAIGGECAGAISLWPEEESPSPAGRYLSISSEELLHKIETFPRRSLLSPEGGIRLSLAGAQNKIPVFLKAEKIYLPREGYSSTHILKPPIKGFEHSVANEAFCMLLAREMGLPVPSVEIFEHGLALLITRYDRVQRGGETVIRLHQEDFCQALGVSSDQKYESEGGPGLIDCFRMVERVSVQPIIDRRNLLRWVLFNVLIGNADAHAKNLSFLYEEGGIKLAPFYDLLSTSVYPDLSQKLAMKIGGENRLDWIQKRHWEALADQIGVKPRLIFSYGHELGEALLTVSRTVESHLEKRLPEREVFPMLKEIEEYIRKRSQIFSSCS